jgi:hypothetical protein
MNTITLSKPTQLEVAMETQVLVAGAGIAGVSAALAAARHGKKVVLLEKQYALGGMATLGLITIYLPLCDGMGHQVCFGQAEELLKLSIAHGHEGTLPDAWMEGGDVEKRKDQRYKVQYNPQLFALSAEKLLRESGVHILYGSYAVDTVVDNGVITHVVVENKSGRTAIAVESVIDCTGDADLCHFSGAPTQLKYGGNGLASWYYYYTAGEIKLKMFGLADVVPDRKDSASTYAAAKVESLDANYRFSGVDGYELSDAVLAGHEKMFSAIIDQRKTSPDLVPVTMSTIPLVRMSRRLCGVHTMTSAEDRAHVADSIGMTGDWCRRGPVYEIPFGALHCSEIKNLLAAGRDISTDDEIWNVTRVIPPCAVTGQAAGTAAALGCDFNATDIELLQAALEADGVKLHRNF